MRLSRLGEAVVYGPVEEQYAYAAGNIGSPTSGWYKAEDGWWCMDNEDGSQDCFDPVSGSLEYWAPPAAGGKASQTTSPHAAPSAAARYAPLAILGGVGVLGYFLLRKKRK